MVDPTFLFSADEWMFLLKDAEINKDEFADPYILCYFVGTRKAYWKYVEKIQKKTGYRVVVIPINNEAYVNHFNKYVKTSPAEFLWLIKNASVICTDSFHATVFSILFKKEFYTIRRFQDSNINSQNGRLEELLSRYKLLDRLIKDETCFKRMENIDYAPIFKELEQERKLSKQWLENALSK